jgi:hypothetical protein
MPEERARCGTELCKSIVRSLAGNVTMKSLLVLGPLEDLVAYAGTIEPPGSNAFKALSSFDRALKFVDDFSAVVAICLGAKAKGYCTCMGQFETHHHSCFGCG